VIFLGDFLFVRIFLKNYRVTMTTTLDTSCSENIQWFCQQGEGFCMHVFSSANFKLDQSVSAIRDSPPYFCDQWGWPPTQHRWSPTPQMIDNTRWLTVYLFLWFSCPRFSRGWSRIAHGRWRVRHLLPKWRRLLTQFHAILLVGSRLFFCFDHSVTDGKVSS
jgi:hypothetical protein